MTNLFMLFIMMMMNDSKKKWNLQVLNLYVLCSEHLSACHASCMWYIHVNFECTNVCELKRQLFGCRVMKSKSILLNWLRIWEDLRANEDEKRLAKFYSSFEEEEEVPFSWFYPKANLRNQQFDWDVWSNKSKNYFALKRVKALRKKRKK